MTPSGEKYNNLDTDRFRLRGLTHITLNIAH